jgi:hypothetical protein
MMRVDDVLRMATSACVTVQVEGSNLVLEYDADPPEDVIAALKAAKPAIVGELRVRSARDHSRREEVERREIVRWINNNFVPSAPGICCHCGGGPRAGDGFVLLFVGSDRADVHSSCHPAWLAAREAEARIALGIDA